MVHALLLQQREQQAESAASSSQASTNKVAWDTPFVRALNSVKGHTPLKRPHMGRVVGVGQGRKHHAYGLAPQPGTSRTTRVRPEAQENENLRAKLADLEESIPRRVEDQLAIKLNEIWPTMMESMSAYIAGGRQGPVPMFSLGGSNSINVSPPSAPPSAPHQQFVTPDPAAAANNAAPREESPAFAGSSPSVTCTPTLGPSPLAELEALTVTN